MREMILGREVVPGRFTIHEQLPEGAPAADSAIPLDDWLRLRAAGAPLDGVGVVVRGDQSVEPLHPHLKDLPFVALPFPKFADGRVYSHAVRLRRLWRYGGRILAYGDVLRDQLHYMMRSGFDAFVLREDQDPHAAVAAFDLYDEHYQYN